MFFLIGTIIGSFFNVVIWRVPRGESVVSPPSHCPNCGHEIKWYENFPILSYLFLRGKCSECKTHISAQYPIIEFITGLFSLAIFQFYLIDTFSSQYNWLDAIVYGAQYLTILLFIPIALIDIRHFIIPDEFTIGGLVIGLIISFSPGGITPVNSLLGVLAGGGTLYLTGLLGQVILKKEETMGGGDIKMLAWFGAIFGPFVAFGAIFLGSLLGSVGAIIAILIGKMKKSEPIPFGPYLCGGALLSIFWGRELWILYSSLFGLNLQ
jgi:leader peptidase (prepilin peptidase)/N-methyltransferase